ncbi:MAG: hypothetical protein PWQ63_22 [Methanolobus sp.]|nr:hypothetical protein [Methanolobus sp.]
MKHNTIQNTLLDSLDTNELKGFRLHKLEVRNWGTFDKNIWTFEPKGFNSIIYGANGSGKSTLVDAILTLLLPLGKITYNKAADSSKYDRTLKSYVLGSYRNEQDEYSMSKSIYLRDGGSYSVILCYFYNHGLDKGMTLAQVFSVNGDDVKKFFVTSEDKLSIQEHFQMANGDIDIFAMKKRIKSQSNLSVFDSYKEYGQSFKQCFGIESDNILDLFFQTVSMKSIPNLTDFMRAHMIEEVSFNDKIKKMLDGYQNLTDVYECIQREEEQIRLLEPMMSKITEHEQNIMKSEDLHDIKDYLPFYFAEMEKNILLDHIKYKTSIQTDLEENERCVKDEISDLRHDGYELQKLIDADESSRRITQLRDKVDDLNKDREKKHREHEKYSANCNSVGIPVPCDKNQFADIKTNVDKRLEHINKQWEEYDNKRVENKLAKDQFDEHRKKLDEEYQSLSSRTTQIPSSNIAIRDKIIEDCSLDGIKLPFVGELIRIRPGENEWKGALERLLHNFGLSILVPEKHYRTISKYVNDTKFDKKRVVYFRVPDSIKQYSRNDTKTNMVIDKVDIEPNSEFHDWIFNELTTKFHLVCCNDINEFQKETKAITKTGQIKGSGGRHEKDDRTNISDRRNYILGWDNKDKIKLIKEQLDDIQQQWEESLKNADQLQRYAKELDDHRTTLNNIQSVTDFNDINWQSIVDEITQYEKDITELKESSDNLKTLENQLDEITKKIEHKEAEQKKLVGDIRECETDIQTRNERLGECENELENNPYDEIKQRPDMSGYLNIDLHDISVKSIGIIRNENINKINETLTNAENERKRLESSITSQMEKFKEKYYEDSSEIGMYIADIPAYSELYNELKIENLPKHKIEFGRKLREDTNSAIASFRVDLIQEVKKITRKVDQINKNLRGMRYNPNTYFELCCNDTTNVTIIEFNKELEGCIGNTLGNLENDNEERFKKIQTLLEKFRKNENNWISNVTDARKWLTYSAKELSCETGEQVNYFHANDPSSGGQKGQVATTVLASALANGYGPGGGNSESNSFRLVILDEAFGKASDETITYSLELFKTLNLQLIIVTPSKNVELIAPYANHALEVHNNADHSFSTTYNMSYEEFTEKLERGRAELMQVEVEL